MRIPDSPHQYALNNPNSLQRRPEYFSGWAFVVSQVPAAGAGAPGHNPTSRPARRDKSAMNGAQLPMAHGNSSGLMSGPPTINPTEVVFSLYPRPIAELHFVLPSTPLFVLAAPSQRPQVRTELGQIHDQAEVQIALLGQFLR